VLLKVVIQAIRMYTTSVFLLPRTMCKQINSMMAIFWWGHKENHTWVAWMGWDQMGLAKMKGGLGFWDIECFNKALLAK
jgi:GH35 family endo-1,4-beta-xylanase